jgi:uncharacterized protein (TIGR03435 family)
MTSDRDAFDKSLHRYLSLFGAPSASQLEVSRARIRERLASGEPSAFDETAAGLVRPRAVSYRWRAGLSLATAAALILVVATVRWTGNDVVRAGDAGRMLTLDDGSRVEMRATSELSIERAADGIGIHLLAGDIIVNAAKQRDGYLYVHTKDMTIAVVGTVFLVNAGSDGSRVAVIEGEVRVRERGTPQRRSGRQRDVETRLRPGEQVATSPTIARRPVKEAITWSRNADAHIAILESFMTGMARSAGPLTPVASAVASPAAAPAQAAPEFEEASIRECDPDNVPAPPAGARGGGANSFYMTPGRTYVLCMTLATIIRTAYEYGPADLDFMNAGRRGRGPNTLNAVYGLGVEDGLRVRGGPDWVRSQRYTIEAVADGAAAGETMRGPMLRALLERRFKLKVHVETEGVPAYSLVVAPGGLKVKRSEPESCITYPVDPTVPRINGVPVGTKRPTLDEIRRGTEKRVCGFFAERNGPNIALVAGQGTFETLALQLALRVGKVAVFDRTGVTGAFDWILEFAADSVVAPGVGRATAAPAPETVDVPRGPSIFAALEEQIGVRLEPTQTPREFLVIDAVERPAPN